MSIHIAVQRTGLCRKGEQNLTNQFTFFSVCKKIQKSCITSFLGCQFIFFALQQFQSAILSITDVYGSISLCTLSFLLQFISFFSKSFNRDFLEQMGGFNNPPSIKLYDVCMHISYVGKISYVHSLLTKKA
jgi:hypothetical protein